MASREKARFGKVMLQGVLMGSPGADTIVLLEDNLGNALLVTGTTVPANTTPGFAKGCLFIDTDVGAGTGGLYCNKGTNTSCTFTLITQA